MVSNFFYQTCVLAQQKGTLRKTRRQRQRERHRTKGLISETRAVATEQFPSRSLPRPSYYDFKLVSVLLLKY